MLEPELLSKKLMTKTCRICLEEEDECDKDKTMIAPCHCNGTCKWVHRECLDTWRVSESGLNAFYQCPNCSFHYEFEKELSRKEWYKSMALITVNTLAYTVVYGILLAAFFALNTFGWMMYTGTDEFVEALPSGVFVSLIIIGVVSTIFFICTMTLSEGQVRPTSSRHDRCDNCNVIYCGDCGDPKEELVFIAIMFAVIGLVVLVAISCYAIGEAIKTNRIKYWKGEIVEKMIVKDLSVENVDV